jgi:hypothetical protein
MSHAKASIAVQALDRFESSLKHSVSTLRRESAKRSHLLSHRLNPPILGIAALAPDDFT